MALWVILGLDLMSAHHRMEHKITKNFLSLILSSAWSPSPLGGNRWELLIKNFRGEREREREREENIYFWKLTKYFVSSFTWERSWLRGQMWEPSQIRYNLVILRMFEIQAALHWIYILLAGFLTPPPLAQPLPQLPLQPTVSLFSIQNAWSSSTVLHIFHMSEVTYWHRKTLGTVDRVVLLQHYPGLIFRPAEFRC